MKNVFLLVALLLSCQIDAQVYGSGKMATITRDFDKIDEVYININGIVDIHCGSPENKITITYDDNIVELVRTANIKGFITIDQEKWIEGTQEVQIDIYTKELPHLWNDSWSKISVTEIDQTTMKVESTISKIVLEGNVDQLSISSESSTIDAYKLIAKEVNVEVTEDGKAYVHATEILNANTNDDDGIIKYIGNPTEIIGFEANPPTNDNGDRSTARTPIDTKYIDITFKNTGWKKISAYVKGPKPSGGYFSYGLNFFPKIRKNERWTVGTKLYKVGLFGHEELIHEVTAADENQVIYIK